MDSPSVDASISGVEPVVPEVNSPSKASVKKLYIIGCPRSGTTWTGLLLARHPKIASCMETSVMQMLSYFTRWSGLGEKAAHSRYVHSIICYDEPADAVVPGVGGQPRFVGLFEPDDLKNFCRSVADQAYARVLALKPAATLLIDKTPQNLIYGEFIAGLFPDAYILHVIRDPRSVVLSLRHGAEDYAGNWPRAAADGARYWRKDFVRAREVAKFSKHYRELRYEAMIENPVREVTALLEWLGIPADETWIRAAVEASSMKEMKKGVAGTPQNFFRKGSASAWQEEFTPSDLADIEYVTGDLMTELGYEFSQPVRTRPPLRLALRDTKHRVAERARSLVRRVRGKRG